MRRCSETKRLQARLIGFVSGLAVTFPIVHLCPNYVLEPHGRTRGMISVHLFILGQCWESLMRKTASVRVGVRNHSPHVFVPGQNRITRWPMEIEAPRASNRPLVSNKLSNSLAWF